jgi:hypothetical protein
MRTTVTIDADNAEAIQKLMAEEPTARAFKKIVNRLLRLGLQSLKAGPPRRYEVNVINTGIKPGWDVERLSDISDEMEMQDEIRKLRGSGNT